MKTLISTLLVSWVALPIVASAQPVKVVASNADVAAICRQIAGPLADVSLLVPPSMNAHNMPLRPSMIQKLREADLMMTIGLDHEPWLLDALNASGNGSIQSGGPGYVDCSQGVKLMNVPTGGVSRSQGDLHVYGNTHYWLEPANGKIMSVHVLHALEKRLPSKSEELRTRTRSLLTQIDQQIEVAKNRMRPFAGKPVVVYHQAMDYLVSFLGLRLVGYVEMRVGVEPSPAHVERIQATMKAENAKLILMEPFFNRSQAETVASGVGAKVLVVPASTAENQSYPDFVRALAIAVEKALKESSS